MIAARWWMVGFGVVWLVGGCTGDPDSSVVVPTTSATATSAVPSSTTSTTVIVGEEILNGFVDAVTDLDAIGVADISTTVDAAGMSITSTGQMRFSRGDSHVVAQVEFLDARTEEIAVGGELFVKDGDGPWLAVLDSSDTSEPSDGPGSETIGFLTTLSNLEYVASETVDGVSLHTLGTSSDFQFDPMLIGFDVPSDHISAFEQSFLVEDDGTPVRWDLAFEAEMYNVMIGRDTVTKVTMEIVFSDWAEYQRITPPRHFLVPYEAERFQYRAALPPDWETVVEPSDGDFPEFEVAFGPSGDEIQVYVNPLEVPGEELLEDWLSWFRDHSTENWGGIFDDSIEYVDVYGRSSPVQGFQHVDPDGNPVYGFYAVAQLSADSVHEFLWYSGPMSTAGDLERFTDFLGSVEPVGSEAIPINDLLVGMCFDDPTGFEPAGYVTPTPCDEPHDNELFATLVMSHDIWPGESPTNAWAVDACEVEFESYTGDTYEESPLDYGSWYPLEAGWEAGDRSVFCFLWDYELNKLVGSEKVGTQA